MNTLAIALMIVIALLLAGVIILLIQGRPKADMTCLLYTSDAADEL